MPPIPFSEFDGVYGGRSKSLGGRWYPPYILVFSDTPEFSLGRGGRGKFACSVYRRCLREIRREKLKPRELVGGTGGCFRVLLALISVAENAIFRPASVIS